MNDYSIIVGHGRTGTKWLSEMLTEHTCFDIPHEPFKDTTWPGTYEEWVRTTQRERRHGICVNSYARHFMTEITEDINPQWLFLLREPLGHVHSAWRRRKESFWKVCHALFGEIEACLWEMEREGIECSFWSMKDYTREEGFGVMVEHLGLKLTKNIQLLPPANTGNQTSQIERPQVRDWTQEQIDYVYKFLELPRMRWAYAEAKEKNK